MATTPETIRYFMSDFDGTIGLIDKLPVGGVSIDNAYAQAIAAQTGLGTEAAEIFIADGGNNHRSALQIVAGLRPDLRGRELVGLSQAVQHDHLDVISGQLGMKTESGDLWPAFTDGFIELYRTITEEKRRRSIGTAIISAGYRDFIRDSFELHDLETPDVIVASEAIDGPYIKLPAEKRGKPFGLPLEMGKTLLDRIHPSNYAIRPVLYIGDSVDRDGGLATNTGSDFILLDPANSRPGWQQAGKWLQLDGYEKVAA